MSQPPRNRTSARPVTQGTRPAGTPNGSQRPRNVNAPPPQRKGNDPFPYIMGAIIGALVVGLGLIAFLIAGGNNSNSTANSNNQANSGNSNAGGAAGSNPPNAQPTIGSGADV